MAKERDTVVLGVRVSKVLAAQFDTVAGGSTQRAALLHSLIKGAVAGKVPRGRGDAQIEGYEDGKRQGWAHANKVFREALGEAAAKLKG